jgi:son of sevenless
VSTTQINCSLFQPKKIDDTRLRGGSLSVRTPRRHPVVVEDDVTSTQISTLIRSADFKQIDNLAASYRDTPFRAISSTVCKPAQEDKLQSKFTEAGGFSFGAISGAVKKEIRKEKVPGAICFGAILGIDKEVEKNRKVVEPEGQVIDIGRPPSDGTSSHLRPQYADQLDIDDKGNVRSGSLLSLFEMLTFPPNAMSKLDDAQAIYASGTNEIAELAQYKTFTNIFLMTFRTFMTADHLFNMLVERFHLKPHELLTDSEYLDWKANLRLPVQRLVLENFSRWLENYQLLEEEPHIAQRLKNFLTLIDSPPHNQTAITIIHTIERMVR